MIKQIKFAKTSNYILSLSEELNETQFYLQQIPIPSVTSGVIEHNNYGHKIKIPGDSLEFGNINLSIILDREWKVYNELINSIMIGHSIDGILQPKKKIFDATVTILSTKNNPIGKFKFHDLFIESVEQVDLDITNTDNLLLQASCVYTYFEFELIGE